MRCRNITNLSQIKNNILCSILDYLFQVADERNRIVMVLEDDIRFVPNFQKEFNELMDDLEKPVMWDFV